MKRKLQKKGSLTAAMLAAASMACFGFAQQADAGVTWLASDDGTNLTLTTTGSLNAGTTSPRATFVGPVFSGAVADHGASIYSFSSFYNVSETTAGALSGNSPWISASLYTTPTTSGHSFGFIEDTLLYDTAFGTTPGIFTPVTSMTFDNLTVADAFGTNLDAGPVLLWTHGTTNDTISVALVPEPSSTALLGLGGIALTLRRRRR